MAKKNSEFINRLRGLLKVFRSNAELAKASGVSDSRIPEWIAGKRLPSPETLIRLGKIALEHGVTDPFFFWALAGMDTRTLRQMAEQVLETRYSVAGETVPIPRFRYVGGRMEESGGPVLLSAEFVPNPVTTICLCVDDKSEGVADSPRGIILLDTSARGTEWREQFSGKVVLLEYWPKVVTAWPIGLYMGRLFRDAPPMVHSGGIWVRILLETLTEETQRAHGYWMPIGTYRENLQALKATPEDKEKWDKAVNEFRGRAISNLRLDQGVQIVGKVLGRLTGHLEPKPDK
jgi:transcriptional regulator with XRE-family HTH domain